MATPPSSPSPTKLAAAAVDTAAATSNPLVKPPPATWSHQETVQLIQIYRDKWYSNNRAHLKTIQWEEVAAAVASRCGVSGKLPPKTAIQCRHKIEKLRKRFRAERKRGNVGPAGWPYYDLMDRLEHGPKASVMPLSIIPLMMMKMTKTMSRDRTVVHKASTTSSDGQAWSIGSRETIPPTAPFQIFLRGTVGIENAKMQMMKEAERSRLEMETKRMELIIDSQKKMVEAIAKALVGDPLEKQDENGRRVEGKGKWR